MANKSQTVFTIGENNVNYAFEHDNESGVFDDNDDNEFTIIKLNELIEKAKLDYQSEIGKQIRELSSIGKPIPKKLVYAILKEHLQQIEQTKPILIVDRDMSFDYGKSGVTNTCCQINNGLPNSISIPVPVAPGAEVHNKKTLSTQLLDKVKAVVVPHYAPRPPVVKDESNFVVKYFKKMKGGQKLPPYERPIEALQALISSFIGIIILTAIDHFCLQVNHSDYTVLIGSFGASAVLLFCAIKSPLAQPRNVIGGHVIAAIVGAAVQLLLGSYQGTRYQWVAGAVAVSIAISLMCLTNTVHPPAGATALIAVYSQDNIHHLGMLYVVLPVLSGVLILVAVAIIVNNIFPSRRYPQYWL